MVQPKYGRSLSLGGKEKISPSLGRKARVKVNLGKRPRRETGVPGGKPKARLNLGINPEEAVLSPGKEPKVSQDSGRDLRVDLNPARKPAGDTKPWSKSSERPRRSGLNPANSSFDKRRINPERVKRVEGPLRTALSERSESNGRGRAKGRKKPG